MSDFRTDPIPRSVAIDGCVIGWDVSYRLLGDVRQTGLGRPSPAPTRPIGISYPPQASSAGRFRGNRGRAISPSQFRSRPESRLPIRLPWAMCGEVARRGNQHRSAKPLLARGQGGCLLRGAARTGRISRHARWSVGPSLTSLPCATLQRHRGQKNRSVSVCRRDVFLSIVFLSDGIQIASFSSAPRRFFRMLRDLVPSAYDPMWSQSTGNRITVGRRSPSASTWRFPMSDRLPLVDAPMRFALAHPT
jgi:hypothetical protein